MPYVVVTEEQASGEEYFREAMDRLREVFVANAAVLKAGERVVVEEAVHVGTQSVLNRFPAIKIELTLADESPWTLVGDDGENRLRMTFRLFGYDVALGEPRRLAENLLQLNDRMQTVLRYNPTLDGFCAEIRVQRVTVGRLRGGPRTTNPVFAPHPIHATQMDVSVVKEIARP